MQPSFVTKERPPYVRFEQRAKEAKNSDGTIRYYIQDLAIITAVGTKDIHEKPVDSWFESMSMLEKMDRWPHEWTRKFKEDYAEWKRTNEVPITGTAIANWPVVTKAQSVLLRAINVHTVEDLAAANEETLGRIGMGARALKQMASDWILASGGDQATLVQRLGAAQITIETLEKKLKEQGEELKKFGEALKHQANPREVQAVPQHFGRLDAESLRDAQETAGNKELDSILGIGQGA